MLNYSQNIWNHRGYLIIFELMSSENKNQKVEVAKTDGKEILPVKKAKQIQKDAEVLRLLEEDEDDFQEFEEEAYDANPPTKNDEKQWRVDWEDEDMNDEFTQQLKRELAKA